MSRGVIASAGGAAARAGVANRPSASAPVPFSTSRREGKCFFIARSLSAQRPAAFGWQAEPDVASLTDDIAGPGHDTQRRAVCCFDQIVAACAQKHLPYHADL